MTRALLERALEALESLFSGQVDRIQGPRCANAIQALRAELAKPEREQQLCGHCGRKTIDDPWPTKAQPEQPAHTEAEVQELGMTLRDYFAAKAMQGMLANDCQLSDDRVSEWAYSAADAMMKARCKS